MNNYELIIPLVAGFFLDALLGDPYWLPHPVRLFGKLIYAGEKGLNKGRNKKLKGGLFAIVLIAVTYFVFFCVFELLENLKILYLVVASLFVFYGLANRSLIVESLKVIRKLNGEGIVEARKQLSTIVGRETKNLNENQMRIAVLETLSENLSDGVVAPLFYYAFGGLPAMFAYKMVNTLDSMIGYKNERFVHFGYFAAKIDDVVNYIPSRVTAFLMVLITLNFRGLKFMYKYGRKHSSPNAGFPEAALAGILNCRFGGPNYYSGMLVEKPFIGNHSRAVYNKDIYKACIINFFVALMFSAAVILLWWV